MVDRSVAPEFRSIEKVDLQKAVSGELDNGLPLHIVNAGTQPVIRIELICHSGIWFESKDGVSFLTTKMLTEGSRQKNAHQISEYFDRYGAFLELNPGFDFNTISLYVMTKQLEKTLPVFREILTESIFPEHEFRILKNNAISDLKIKNAKNNVVASRKFRELIFGKDHPYGKELTEEAVSKIDSTADLQEYFREVFHNQAEIIASGLVNDDHIEMINYYFGNLKRGQARGNDPVLPSYSRKKETIEKDDSVQSSIRVGKRLFGKEHPDYLKTLVANEVLGGYFGSRLMKNLREEKGLTYGVYSRLMNFKNEGYFFVSLDVNKEHAYAAVDEIYKEIRELQIKPVPADELEIVKNQMIGGFLNEVSSPFALAEKFKAIHFHSLDYGFYQDFVSAVNTITPEEIMEMTARHFNIEEMSEAIVG